MIKKNKKVNMVTGDIDPAFFNVPVNYGVIYRAPLKDIQLVDAELSKHPTLKVIFTKVSLQPLWIIEKEGEQ